MAPELRSLFGWDVADPMMVSVAGIGVPCPV